MGQVASKRKDSRSLFSFRRQTGVSLIPALMTICIFTLLATQVIIPNQERNSRETNINAVASGAERLIQASYAFRSATGCWPKGILASNTSWPPINSKDALIPNYLPFFHNVSPWKRKGWFLTNTYQVIPGVVCEDPTKGGEFYFSLETHSEEIAQALVQKIGSYAKIDSKTTVRIYPVTISATTIDNLTIAQDINVKRNIILTGKIMASDGTTTLFDASSSSHPTSPGIGADNSHYHSSKRYKQNIQPLDIPIKSIYQLNPVSFDYKDPFKQYKTPNAVNKEIGLIAEQVMPLIPEITLVEDNKVVGIDYPKLSILLLKAVQELKAEVTGLQQSNLQLQQQINNLTTSSPLHKSNEINEREEMQ